MRDSATGFNTRVTALADKIQTARMKLKEENPDLQMSDTDTRKGVVYCLLYLLFGFNNARSLEDVLKELGFLHSKNICSPRILSASISQTLVYLVHIKEDPEWKQLLSYSCEALEYDVDDYYSVNVNRGVRSSNSKKKSQGIYYTPKDVIDFMVSRCLGFLLERKQYPEIVDCSCGSGLFLINCLKYLETVYNSEHSLDVSLNLLKQCIWGVDISPAAIDCCKMTFAQYYIDCYIETSMHFERVWSVISNCFFVGDSKNLKSILENNDSLPERFDCIIGNPPYVSKGRSSNLFIPFVDNMMQFSSEIGFSALVLPLSICYSKGEKYTALRQRIQIDRAKWEFLNYDRAPDSLFGDQVKTRNTILFRDASHSHTIRTTKLQRWTSDNRESLFTEIELCDISEINITSTIPKISDPETKALYKKLCEGDQCLLDLLEKQRENENTLLVNGTAYNWLCVYDHIPSSTDENGRAYVSGSSKKYCAADKRDQYFCLALMSNRIAYWFWMATGDGFHLNTSFLAECHLSRNSFSDDQYEYLWRLGEEYSSIVKKHPTVSYNAGKTIINYSHIEAMDTVEKIEKTIITALNLSDNLLARIKSWYEEHVHCNRE